MLFDVLLAYLLLGTIPAVLLFIWFKTNAFVEYISFFGFGSKFHVNEYIEATKDDPSTTYTEYLAANHSNFFVRMVTCSNCLGIQLAALVNIPIFLYLQFTTVLLIWALFPISSLTTSYFALCLYYSLVKLIK